MRVLVTGGTGFIGQYVLSYLNSYSDIDVVILSRKSISDRLERQSYVRHDILNDNHEGIAKKCGYPDVVIHLAWSLLDDYENSDHINKLYPKHLRFLTGLINQGVNNMTIIGTCLEYGMREGCLNEEMQSNPTTFYSKAKDQLRKDLFNSHDQEQLSLKWLRLFYLYGKGQPTRSVLAQLEEALSRGDKTFNMSRGDQIRDYLHVEDAARFIVEVALQNTICNVINCCSGKPITIKKLVEKYIHSRGKKINLNLGYYPYPKYEPMIFWGDTEKLKSIIKT